MLFYFTKNISWLLGGEQIRAEQEPTGGETISGVEPGGGGGSKEGETRLYLSDIWW